MGYDSHVTLIINKWTIGPILIAISLLIASFAKVAIDQSWKDHIGALVLVLLGALTVLFTDEMVEHLEEYGIDEGLLTSCPKFAKAGAMVTLLIGSNMVFGII